MSDCISVNSQTGNSHATLYEDEDFRVILDTNPATKGTARFFRRNITPMSEIPDELLEKAFILAKSRSTHDGSHGLRRIEYCPE